MQTSEPIVGTDMTSTFAPVQNGQPVNPATVNVFIRQGDDDQEVDLTGSIQHLGPGDYTVTYTSSRAGRHRARWVGASPGIVGFDFEHVSPVED